MLRHRRPSEPASVRCFVSRLRRSVSMAVTLVALAEYPEIPEPGCSGPVNPGDYQVTLDEKQTTQSPAPSCGELDSIAVGSILPLTIS